MSRSGKAYLGYLRVIRIGNYNEIINHILARLIAIFRSSHHPSACPDACKIAFGLERRNADKTQSCGVTAIRPGLDDLDETHRRHNLLHPIVSNTGTGIASV